jgi:DNA anti-recombination protein RmuC
MNYDDTDFDLLCEGVSSAEAKRLRKLLAEWCKGDENSFPVQLALLTRAQWRAASSVPKLIHGTSENFEQQIAAQGEQFTALVRTLQQSGDTKLKDLEKLFATQEKHIAQQVGRISSELSAAQTLSKRIQSDLEKSYDRWQDAYKRFETERLRLVTVIKELEDHCIWREWFGLVLAFLIILSIGVLIGMRWMH